MESEPTLKVISAILCCYDIYAKIDYHFKLNEKKDNLEIFLFDGKTANPIDKNEVKSNFPTPDTLFISSCLRAIETNYSAIICRNLQELNNSELFESFIEKVG